MVTKRQVLELIAERSADGRKTSYRSVVRWLPLSFEGACAHLERLWRERLIEATTPRQPRFRFRLEPCERISGLRFWLTGRGADRLDWYAMRDEGQWPS
jgi:hypothetical protein